MKEVVKERYLYILGTILCIMIGVAICVYPFKPELQMKIIYEFGLPENTTGKMMLQDKQAGYELYGQMPINTYKYYEMTYALPAFFGLENMEIIVQEGVERSRIRAIEFYNHNLQIKRLPPSQIPDYFMCIADTDYTVDSVFITYTSESGSPGIKGTHMLYEELETIIHNYKSVRMNLFFYLIIGYGIYIFAVKRLEEGRKKKMHAPALKTGESSIILDKNIHLFFCAFLGMIFLLVFLMAVKSIIYGHPDENVTRMAIDYYLGGWLRPGLGSSWAAGTFSEHGSTRLSEHTWYYLLAGKAGWIVERFLHLAAYYRLFNVMLLGIMILMTVRYGRHCPWMFFVLLFTPQLWYLFSYATSDAWDALWSFVAVFELTWENSLLNRYLKNNKDVKKNIMYAAACGVIFSFLLEAKKNYYIILLLVFFVLLFRMLFSKRWKTRFLLLFKYTGILLFAFLFVYGKYKMDDILPERDKENVISGIQIDVEEGMPYGTKLHEKGVTLQELLSEWNFGNHLFRSFTGSYGWVEYPGSRIYNCIMLFLYMLLYMMLIAVLYKYGDQYKYMEAIVVLGLNAFLLFIVVYWCLYIDFQPQGRYMIPLVFCIGYQCQRCREIWKNKYYICTLVCVAALSLYSFVRYGLFNLIRL